MIEFFRKRAKTLPDKSSAAQPGGGQRPVSRAAMEFHPSSYADPHGRVFSVGGRLYRGVPSAAAAFCAQLFTRGVVQTLVEKKLLVPTRISDLKAEGFDLVLEHERVAYVSFPLEWPAEMLRAAAFHTLDLLEELERHGLTLKDAHGWNILFDGCRPVFVDFGSIIDARPGEPWAAEQEFREWFLYPLELLAAGVERYPRALMRDFERGIRLEDVQALAALANQPRPEVGQAMPFGWYRERLAALQFGPKATAWAGYYDGEFPVLTPDATWNGKHRSVHELLQRFRPATVLDIGANRGWYSMLAAKGGAKAIAFDNDEVCVNHLFRDAQREQLDVQPLVISCLNPTPRYGLGRGVMESAAERLQCDLVLALAMVHHMAFRMYLNFDQIAEGLAAYTKKTLVVEFPPSDDFYVKQWMTERYAWYRVENFETALRRHFRKIEIVASHPAPRILLVCER